MASPTILVVDDDPGIRAVCTDLLESEGYAVVPAGNGQEALTRTQTARPDVVLMDIMMPILDGVTACTRLKNDPSTARIPVALMSARGNLDRLSQELACCDAVLSKPFDIDQLLATVEQLVFGH